MFSLLYNNIFVISDDIPGHGVTNYLFRRAGIVLVYAIVGFSLVYYVKDLSKGNVTWALFANIDLMILSFRFTYSTLNIKDTSNVSDVFVSLSGAFSSY